jgi:hypothetical protein
MTARGETRVGGIEMGRYEECTVILAQDNDVIVASVIIAWMGTLISTMKLVGHGDWPVGHSVKALGMLFQDLPANCQTTILFETLEVARSFSHCQQTDDQHYKALKYIVSPHWHQMYNLRQAKWIFGEFMEFSDALYANFVRMRMIAT